MPTTDAPRAGAVVRRVLSIGVETRAESDTGPLAVSLSSEEPVERAFGVEILDHGQKAVNLDRAERGLPLLFAHDPRQPIGRVEKIRRAGRKLRGEIRFGSSTLAKEIERDVRDGILDSVSVGYRVDRVELEPGSDTAQPVYRVLAWTPLEVSIVSIAADTTVGVGRSETFLQEYNLMTAPNTDPRVETRTDPSTISAAERERARILDIEASAKRWGFEEQGRRAIVEGWRSEDFAKWLLEHGMPKGQPLETPTSAIGMGKRDVERFSILRAAQALATRDWRAAGFEREASDAVEKQIGRAARGFFVPADVLHAPSVRAVTKAGSGGSLVETELRPEAFIEVLRNAAQVRQAGATILPGLVGNIDLPRQSGSVGAEWLAEAGTVTGGDPTFDTVSMAPRTVAGKTAATRKMLLQSSPAIEQLVREDLAQSLALAIDRAATFGSGAGAEPRGIVNVVGIGSLALGTDGAALTWADVVELESLVAAANADGDAMAYLTNARVRGALKRSEKAASTAEYIWPDRPGDASVNGRRALVSNQVPSNLTKGSGTNLSAMIYGNWRDLLIGEWGILDVTAENVTLADSGGLTVRAFMDVDIAVRHPESFAVVTDVIA